MVPEINVKEPYDEERPPAQPGGVVSWSPPQPNWNPWTGCNMDEGPLAKVCSSL